MGKSVGGKKGVFITFEGGEGTGKTTQLYLLANFLRDKHIFCLTTREPGGPPQAEVIRDLLIEGAPQRWDPVTEAFLMAAARREHLKRTIWPALEEGKWVISDRFSDSTLAYQGYGHGLGVAFVHQLRRLTMGSFQPDLTFIFYLSPEEGLLRKQKQALENRFEKMSDAFHHKVWLGYQALAREEPERCIMIQASQDIEKIATDIQAHIKSRFLKDS